MYAIVVSMGVFRDKPVVDQYMLIDDMKVRMTVAAMSDKYSEAIRTLILRCYNDTQLLLIYKRMRDSGDYDKGSKDKSYRKLIEFPNAYVYDFVDTVLKELYGKQWLKDSRALKHDLVKPWLVVGKL